MPGTLGRYTLQRKFASGGMANIWLATLPGPGGFASQVVVKTLREHLAMRPEFIKMLVAEARLVAQLHHPNIAQIFELGRHEDTFFLAMEYVPGVNLRRLFRDAEAQKKPVPLPLAVRIIAEVAKALGYAHAALDEKGLPLKLVHRDVSPDNVLVTYEGGVKLIDFGIAKALDQITDTRVGVIKGKYSYMAPERVELKQFDGRADLFSLGVVAFEILTGFKLFKRDHELATVAAVSECKVPVPSSLSAEIPESLDPILLKALAKSPRDRYPDGASLALALEQFLADRGAAASSTHLAAYMAELYPNPGLPQALEEAETESISARRVGPTGSSSRITVHDRTKPPLPASAEPAAPPREMPTLRAAWDSQIAARGPIRDPKIVRAEAAAAAITEDGEPHDRSTLSGEVILPEQPRWTAAGLRRAISYALWIAAVGALGWLAVKGGPALWRSLRHLPEAVDAIASPDAGPRGLLSLDTSPAATVYLGNQPVGRTPLVEVELPAGHQRLELVNDVAALDETLDVDVRPGAPLLLRHRFPEGTIDLSVPAGKQYRVLYKESLLGRIPGPAIELAAGTHTLTLIDELTGERETRTVAVAPRP